MRAQTQLALLQQLRQRQNLVRKGFTLVELMIVVAIIGLLSAVALPQFMSARDRADAQSKVGELVGISKECAVFNAEGNPVQTTVTAPGGGVIMCGGAPASVVTLSSRAWKAGVPGVMCLGSTVLAANTHAVITIQAGGGMGCVGAT